MGASGCESGNLPGLVEAGTLREKECGDWPRYSREAFLLVRRDSLLARLAERAWVAQVVDAGPSQRRPFGSQAKQGVPAPLFAGFFVGRRN
jgi:hypothetical protein